MRPALNIAVIALALAAGSALAQGYGYGPGMRGGYGPGMGYGAAFANLSDEQRTKIAAIQEQHRARNWKLMGELRAEQFKLRELYASERADSAAVATQQKKVDGLREQMWKQHEGRRGEIDAVLTPEQRKEWQQHGPWWGRGRS
jgi:Spy/CpxP family protein refolding chaperone